VQLEGARNGTALPLERNPYGIDFQVQIRPRLVELANCLLHLGLQPTLNLRGIHLQQDVGPVQAVECSAAALHRLIL